jgi:DNA-binding response OmpR family regulator
MASFKSAATDHYGPRESTTGGRARLLLVEADFLIRFALGEFLRARGYIVFQAATVDKAKHVFETAAPLDVLLANADLGRDQDGVALARWVRDHHPRTRILLLSDDLELSPDPKPLCDGPLIGKPYSYGGVADEIAKLLRRNF